MLTFADGNIFDCKDADIYVNTVNCVGVMGKGVALDFKNLYPEMNKEYEKYCAGGFMQPGGIFIWTHPSGKPTILNFATKKHWWNPSRYKWIKDGLEELYFYLMKQDPSIKIVMPAIGCGNGKLDWEVVKERIKVRLGDLSQNIIVYNPQGVSR